MEIKLMNNLFKFIIIQFLIISCTINKYKLCVNSNKKEIKKLIEDDIDSVYSSDVGSKDFRRKTISMNCVCDSILEVKTETEYSSFILFYFDNRFNLVEVKYELPPIHVK
jgi:hypothetical protein